MYFYLIVALQAFCIYHIWKTRRPFYWFFIIILVPLLGSIVYLLTQALNKSDVEKIQQDVTTIINPTKRISDLEAAVKFSDTYQNRVALADALFENSDWDNALTHYNAALEGNFKTDFYLNSKLLETYFNKKQYELAVTHGDVIKNDMQFTASKVAFYYGLALDKLDRSQEAQQYLVSVDRRYSNFNERLQLAEHYLANEQKPLAIEILDELDSESQNMHKDTFKQFRTTFTTAARLRASL
ncbi:MAG: hypothetical protein ABJM06_01125 [Gilvibacter sp.]